MSREKRPSGPDVVGHSSRKPIDVRAIAKQMEKAQGWLPGQCDSAAHTSGINRAAALAVGWGTGYVRTLKGFTFEVSFDQESGTYNVSGVGEMSNPTDRQIREESGNDIAKRLNNPRRRGR